MLTVVLLALTAIVGIAALLKVQAARHQAQSAADLSALAAANEMQSFGIGYEPTGGGVCSIAQQTARRNGVEIKECRVEGHDVVVATYRATRALGLSWNVSAQARAGPTE